MPYKLFDAPDGTKWEVWVVMPTAAERRQVQRRKVSSALSGYRGPERRISVDRRREDSSGRTLVSPGFEHGWLCFESASGEKRRLVPIPDGWESATPEELWAWCESANEVPKCDPS
ncbi:MAG: hypothetical protein M3365_11120 [Gemmatimonadota bacterium]|nr:hypothetical protein [Gemmatimonadota bacterium]